MAVSVWFTRIAFVLKATAIPPPPTIYICACKHACAPSQSYWFAKNCSREGKIWDNGSQTSVSYRIWKLTLVCVCTECCCAAQGTKDAIYEDNPFRCQSLVGGYQKPWCPHEMPRFGSRQSKPWWETSFAETLLLRQTHGWSWTSHVLSAEVFWG